MVTTDNRTKEYYDRNVENWFGKFGGFGIPLRRREALERLVPKGGLLLDAGCGPGTHDRQLMDLGYRVIAVDYSEEMIKKARHVAPQAEFHCMDLRDLQFGDNTFDCVWANASLLHIERADIPNVLKNFWRVLKPDGTLMAVVRQGRGEGDKIDGWGTRRFVFYSIDEFSKLIKEAGFEVLEAALEADVRRASNSYWIAVYARAQK